MPIVEVNLNEVKEKPRLPAGQDFEFVIVKANPAIAKNANKHSGVREPYIACEVRPVHPDFADKLIYWNPSLAQGALESDDPTFSIKKFFAIVGHPLNPQGGFSTEDLMTIRFIGQVKYKEGESRPNLAKVLRRA